MPTIVVVIGKGLDLRVIGRDFELGQALYFVLFIYFIISDPKRENDNIEKKHVLENAFATTLEETKVVFCYI